MNVHYGINQLIGREREREVERERGREGGGGRGGEFEACTAIFSGARASRVAKFCSASSSLTMFLSNLCVRVAEILSKLCAD